jgi:hypothetical protein
MPCYTKKAVTWAWDGLQYVSLALSRPERTRVMKNYFDLRIT